MFQTITKTGPHVYVTHKIDFIKLDYEKKIEKFNQQLEFIGKCIISLSTNIVSEGS